LTVYKIEHVFKEREDLPHSKIETFYLIPDKHRGVCPAIIKTTAITGVLLAGQVKGGGYNGLKRVCSLDFKHAGMLAGLIFRSFNHETIFSH